MSGPPSPGPSDFEFPAIALGVTKPMVLAVLSVVIIVVLFRAMARPAAVVPGRLQFAGEMTYDFVRNSIARENIGAPDYMRYVPYLFATFLFVLVNNFYGVIPFLQFPTMSRFGFPVALALIAWVIYNVAGIAKHGFFGYLKHTTVPGGTTGPILLIMIPLEFFSNIIVRPFTLALRLFATMFAGHLLIVLFSLGAEYLIFNSGNPLYIAPGILSFVAGIAISFLDMLIMFLQAYVFTLLSAMYIGGSVADEH
ncbi:F0F1 ATP synthase subunit A [Aeromicrobium sp. CF4.19]|uniref:F0F1 ATP synthase subunit A n=1 Tax=Aeromicrobium sp. CF4.19 TaxID=3373082 RepID=UPI003EE4A17E